MGGSHKHKKWSTCIGGNDKGLKPVSVPKRDYTNATFFLFCFPSYTKESNNALCLVENAREHSINTCRQITSDYKGLAYKLRLAKPDILQKPKPPIPFLSKWSTSCWEQLCCCYLSVLNSL